MFMHYPSKSYSITERQGSRAYIISWNLSCQPCYLNHRPPCINSLQQLGRISVWPSWYGNVPGCRTCSMQANSDLMRHLPHSATQHTDVLPEYKVFKEERASAVVRVGRGVIPFSTWEPFTCIVLLKVVDRVFFKDSWGKARPICWIK